MTVVTRNTTDFAHTGVRPQPLGSVKGRRSQIKDGVIKVQIPDYPASNQAIDSEPGSAAILQPVAQPLQRHQPGQERERRTQQAEDHRPMQIDGRAGRRRRVGCMHQAQRLARDGTWRNDDRQREAEPLGALLCSRPSAFPAEMVAPDRENPRKGRA